jgi:hypothetical protein
MYFQNRRSMDKFFLHRVQIRNGCVSGMIKFFLKELADKGL